MGRIPLNGDGCHMHFLLIFIFSFIQISVYIKIFVQTAGVVLLIVQLIIRSITLECEAVPCYDWSAFLISLLLFILFFWTLTLFGWPKHLFSITFILFLISSAFSSAQFVAIILRSINFVLVNLVFASFWLFSQTWHLRD